MIRLLRIILGLDKRHYGEGASEDGRYKVSKEKFRDSMRSAWLQVAAITYMKQNGAEFLPDWGPRLDFSLLSLKNTGLGELLGGNLLDLIDSDFLKNLFDVKLGETLDVQDVSVNIEALNVETTNFDIEQSSRISLGTGTSNFAGGVSGVTGLTGAQEFENIPVDAEALAAYLEFLKYLQLLALTEATPVPVAQFDLFAIDATTGSVSGDLTQNDFVAPGFGLFVASVDNDPTLVDQAITHVGDTDQHDLHGTLTINTNGTFQFLPNLADIALIQMDTGESITVFAPFAVSDGLLRLEEYDPSAPFDAVFNPLFIAGVTFAPSVPPNDFTAELDAYAQFVEPNWSLLQITIGGVNDAPVANDDMLNMGNISEDDMPPQHSINVIANDTDPDLNDLPAHSNNLRIASYSVNGGPSIVPPNGYTELELGGIFSVDEFGNITYTINTVEAEKLDDNPGLPNDALFRDFTLTYTLTDGDLTDIGTLTFRINGVNDEPIGNMDAFTITEDQSIGGATNVITGDNGFGIDMDPDEFGNDQNLLFVSTLNGTPLLGASSPFTLNSGAGILNASGALSFITNAQFLDDGEQLVDTFTYRINDTTIDSTDTTVTITVTGVNDAPIPFNDFFTTNEDTPLGGQNIITQDNGGGSRDTDPDTNDLLNNLSVATVNGVAFTGSTVFTSAIGAHTFNADGTYSFTANAAQQALDDGESAFVDITYGLTDGDITVDAVVRQTVTGLNDAPVANPDAFALGEDTVSNALNVITSNDTDPDTNDLNNNLRLQNYSVDGGPVITPPNTFTDVQLGGQFSATGLGLITYTNNLSESNKLDDGESRVFVVTYTLTDGDLTDTSTLTVTINGANDAPIPFNDFFTTNEDTPLGGQNIITQDNGGGSRDTDPDTNDLLNNLSVATVNGVAFTGSTVFTSAIGAHTFNADGTYSFTANAAQQALDDGESAFVDITYGLTDGDITVDAVVRQTVTGLNDPPDGMDDLITTDQNTPITLANGINLITGDNGSGVDTDPDTNDLNNNLRISEVNGTGFTGTTTVVLSNASVTLDDQGNIINATPNAAQIALGVGEFSEATFTYTLTDGTTTDPVPVNVTIRITGLNDTPTAGDDTYAVTEGNTVNSNVLVNDTDPDTNDVLSVSQFSIDGGTIFHPAGTVVTDSKGNQIQILASGAIVFIPGQYLDQGQTDLINVLYTASDGNGGIDMAQVNVMITGVESQPVATDDALGNVLETAAPLVGNLLANDFDPDLTDTIVLASFDGQTFTGGPIVMNITNAGGATVGTLTVEQNGQYTITSNSGLGSNENAVISKDYTITDGTLFDTGNLNFTLVGVNDRPMGSAPAGLSVDDRNDGNPAAITFDLIATDPDLNDKHVVFSISGLAYTLGTIVNTNFGTLVFQDMGAGQDSLQGVYTVDKSNPTVFNLDEGESINDVISMTIRDDGSSSDLFFLTVTINGINEELFTENADTIVFDNVTDGVDYFTGGTINIYDAKGGNDVVTLPTTVAEANEAGYILLNGDTETTAFSGGAGDDIITGSPFTDTLNGGPGNDTLDGAGGENNILNGEGDNDTLISGNPASGSNTLDGGAGFDFVSYVASTQSLGIVQMNATFSVDYGGTGPDSVLNVEGFIGSNFGETIIGTTGDNSIFGMGGDDVIQGVPDLTVNSGNDYLDGGAGDDQIRAGNPTANGTMTLVGGLGTDTLTGGTGNDTLIDNATDNTIDTLSGGFGNDTYQVGNDGVLDASTRVMLPGGGGAGINAYFNQSTGAELNRTGTFNTLRDSIIDDSQGGSQNNVVMLTDGNDSLTLTNGGTQLYNSDVDHTPGSFTGISTILGMDGNDEIVVPSLDATVLNLTLDGGDGNDIIWGANNSGDILIGGDGNDILWGGDNGLDTLTGGTGQDSFQIGANSNFVQSAIVTDFNVTEDSIVIYDSDTSTSTGVNINSVVGNQVGADFAISYTDSVGLGSGTITLQNFNPGLGSGATLTDMQNAGINVVVA